MAPPSDGWETKRRRTVLQLIGVTASAGILKGTANASAATGDEAVVMEQGDRCVELTPLSGQVPVEDLYNYTYPLDRYGGPPGSQGTTYSSEGTTDLQRDRTSILFPYAGPEGLSLVIVHGKLNGDRDAGGTVTFTVRGLPEEATWIVRDDYYLNDGEVASSNYDRWELDGDAHVVDWAYIDRRTDGGVVRGLGDDFEVTIEPAFNDDAALASDHDFGPIEAWEALGGDREEPERYPLRLDLPVTVRTGTCDDRTEDGDTSDGEGSADEEEDTSDGDRTTEAESTDDDDGTDGGTTEGEADEGTDDAGSDDEGETTEDKSADDAETTEDEEAETSDDGEPASSGADEETEEGGNHGDEKKERKHRKKREKHEGKHEKKQRKHRKKRGKHKGKRKKEKHKKKKGNGKGNGKGKGKKKGRKHRKHGP